MESLLDVAAAATYLGTSERHVRALILRRELPYTKIGRLVRFIPADLDAYIKSRKVATA